MVGRPGPTGLLLPGSGQGAVLSNVNLNQLIDHAGCPRRLPRRASILVGAVATSLVTSAGASSQQLRDISPDLLETVFPQADRFESRSGDPPVFQAWAVGEDGGEALVGYVFHTADVPPERRGYSGPIEALVGMDLEGRLTGVRVTDYWESISSSMGDFLRRRGFQEQFRGKHIGDPFSPRDDVDAVSRATISTRGLSLGVRDAARRVANAYLATSVDVDDPVRPLDELSWFELQQRGVLASVQVGSGNRTAEITLAFMESAVFAERLVGSEAVAMSERRWAAKGNVGHVFFYGLDGSDLSLFRPQGWSVVQDGDTLAVDPADFHPFGLAGGGLLASQVVVGGLVIVDPELDVDRAFRFVYDYPPQPPPYSVEYRTESARARALDAIEYVRRDPIRSEPRAPAAPAESTSETDPPIEAAVPPAAATSPVDSAVLVAPSASSATGVPTDEGPDESPLPTAASGEELRADPSLPSDQWVETESVLSETLATTQWGPFWITLLLLVLTLAAFLTKRETLRWVVLALTLGYLGFVDGGFLSVSHITSALSVGPQVFLTDLSLLAMVIFTLTTTLIWGRVFCGYLCPFGALQDFITRLVPRRAQRASQGAAHRRALMVKYGILALVVLATVAGIRFPLYAYVEPFGTVFFLSPSPVLWAIAVAVLLASAVVPRFYCRYVCPLGAALALGSAVAPRRIDRVEQCSHCKVCERHCPTAAITGADVTFMECVRCSDCEVKLIEKAGACRHEASTVRERLVRIRT